MNELMLFEAERRRMVDAQLRRRGIRDERVLNAMLRVLRHRFVPPEFIERAYQDRPLPIGNAETISQPYIVAAMTEAASVKPGDKVFEAGTGSGYQAAILAALGAKVYSLERNPRLAEAARARLARLGYDVEVICADASQGYTPAAPYDVMLVTAASPSIPGVLIDELAEGGRLVIPVGGRQGQRLERVEKTAEGISRQTLEACQFVPLVGKYGWPEEASSAS